MKGDEGVESVELFTNELLFSYRRHTNFALQQFIEEEIEPDAALL